VVRQTPDVRSTLEVVVHPAEILRRVAVRDEPPPRPDDQRQVLDPDWTLVLARPTRRALPQHLLRVDLTELPIGPAGKHCLLRLQDERLGVELFPRSPRWTVHLTAATLHTGERIEHDLAAEILDGLETNLLFLKIEVRQVPELW